MLRLILAALTAALEEHPFVKVVSQGLTVVFLPTQTNQIQHSLHLEILPGVTPAGLRRIAGEIPDTFQWMYRSPMKIIIRYDI